MNKRICFDLSFRLKSINSEQIKEFLEIFKYFETEKMKTKQLTNGKYLKYSKNKLYDNIEKEIFVEERGEITVKNESNRITILRERRNKNILFFTITLTEEIYELNKKEILNKVDSFMAKYNGISACAYSLKDMFWQENEDLDYYKEEGKSIEGLHTKAGSRYNEIIVDIEYNPGHSHSETGIWFGSCWKMWFGKEYFKYIPKEKLLKFKDCYENIEIENEVIRITLHENIWDYEEQENIEKRWKYRKEMEIDNIAHKLRDEYKEDENDPEIEINTGKFASGGEREIIYYLDELGRTIPKSRAKKMVRMEMDSKGNILFKEEKEI